LETITHDLSVGEPVDVSVLPLADLHLGDAQAQARIVRDLINKVLTTEHLYCVLGGDLMDSAIASSIGDTYGATLSPQAQLEHCVDLFQPLADAGKVLAVLPGNHEARISKSAGVDMTRLMALQLGLESVYAPTTALLFLRIGQQSGRSNAARPFVYSVYVTHGHGGGRRPGGKINALTDYAGIVDADVYIAGHTHMPAMLKQSYYRADHAHHTVSLCEKTFVNTASALAYGGYGDTQGYAPASNSYPVITFNGSQGRDKLVTVTL
jgi:hypothetical protein